MRSGYQRAPIERMAYIARLLRDRAVFTAPMVAAKFELDRKTIDRDIAFMRDRLGFTIVFQTPGNRAKHGYRGHGPKRRIL